MPFRVQITPKAGKRYVSVVWDATEDGVRKVKTLKSFGLETPVSLVEAERFRANAEAVHKMSDKAKGDDETAKAILIAFGLILGAAVIAMLLSDDD